MQAALYLIWSGEIDPSFIRTQEMKIDEAPRAYEMFKDHEDECIKVALKPLSVSLLL